MYSTTYRTTVDAIKDRIRKESVNCTAHFWNGSHCIARITCEEPKDLKVVDGSATVIVSDHHYSTGTRRLHIHLQVNR